jgi:hypothetical protein
LCTPTEPVGSKINQWVTNFLKISSEVTFRCEILGKNLMSNRSKPFWGWSQNGLEAWRPPPGLL